MTRSAKIWDFLFGVALIGGAPLAALFVVEIGFFTLRPATDARLIGLVALIFGTTAFGAACFRRWKHRHLRRWILFAEIFVAALVISLFILAVATILRISRG
jgi:hypothetical protein